jgi:GntR family transcriptional repressor for pyruvate dehydrogenase complex
MSRNLTSALVDDLRARIVDGRISPGERLPSESTLIAEHGVSRTVVREAVARLQAEGLVHTRRGSGSFVLTPPAAALAATAREEHQLARMEDALARSEEEVDNPAASLENDFEFHRTVAEASGNPYYVDALTGLGPAMITMPPRRLDGAPGGGRAARVAAEHRSVLDAIRARDPLAASAAMRAHLANSRWRLEAEAGDGPSAAAPGNG